MKIGVISDTHMQDASKELSNLILGAFADVSMVLHAGDLTRISVLEAFSEKKIVAVCGNMDQYDVTDVLPAKQIVTVEGFRIGLAHGWGSIRGIEERLIAAFPGVDAIVYGHTHIPANHVKDGILLFNPGSFSSLDQRGAARSVGLLTVEKGSGVSGKIIRV